MDLLLGREELEYRPSLDDETYKNRPLDLQFVTPKNDEDAEEQAFWRRVDRRPACPVVERIHLLEAEMKRQEEEWENRNKKPKKPKKTKKKRTQNKMDRFVFQARKQAKTAAANAPGRKNTKPPAKPERLGHVAKLELERAAERAKAARVSMSPEPMNYQGFPLTDCHYCPQLDRHVYAPPHYYCNHEFLKEKLCRECLLSPCFLDGYSSAMEAKHVGNKKWMMDKIQQGKIADDVETRKYMIRSDAKDYARFIYSSLFSEDYLKRKGLPTCIVRYLVKRHGSSWHDAMARCKEVLDSDSDSDEASVYGRGHTESYWKGNTKSEGGL